MSESAVQDPVIELDNDAFFAVRRIRALAWASREILNASSERNAEMLPPGELQERIAYLMELIEAEVETMTPRI